MIKPLKRRKLSPTQLFSLHSNSFRHQQKKNGRPPLQQSRSHNFGITFPASSLPCQEPCLQTGKQALRSNFRRLPQTPQKSPPPTILSRCFFLLSFFLLAYPYDLSWVGWKRVGFPSQHIFIVFNFPTPRKGVFRWGCFSSAEREPKSQFVFFCWKLFFLSVAEIEVLCLCVLPSSLFLLGRSKMEIFSAWQGTDFSTLVFYFFFRGRVA